MYSTCIECLLQAESPTIYADSLCNSGAASDTEIVSTISCFMQMRRHGWWRGPAVTSWAQYRIDAEKLLGGCSPLLVFLNTKSGAQVGAMMRRRFLRLLNPLQVRPPAVHSASLHASGTPTPQSAHLPAELSASSFMKSWSASVACCCFGALLVCPQSGACAWACATRYPRRITESMQVVELPKEDPEEALRLFADIAGATSLHITEDLPQLGPYSCEALCVITATA